MVHTQPPGPYSVTVEGGAGEPGAAGETLAEVVRGLLTFGGRAPCEGVETSLSTEQRALVDVLGSAALHRGAAEACQAGQLAHLGTYSYGHVFLSLSAPATTDVVYLGWVAADPGVLVAVEQARARLWASRSGADAQVDAFFRDTSAATLATLVREVTRAIDHVDPVLLYVEDELYTNYDRFNNLLPRAWGPADPRFLLCRLAESADAGRPATSLGIGERRLLFCMHLLGIADLKAEEFNGRQLTPWALEAWFAEKRDQYTQALHAGPGGAGEASRAAGPWPTTLPAQAAWLRAVKGVLRETHTPWRWINGLTFRKEERWRPRAGERAGTGTGELPRTVLQHAARLGVLPEASPHAAAFLGAVVRAIARRGDAAERSAALAELLELVVRAVMEEVPSHLGMTRGMRDLRHFQDAVEERRFDDVCAAPMADGYCAVFARAPVGEGPPGAEAPGPTAAVLTAISRRMQFNHWHYTPGHFAGEPLSVRRHYYTPPATSDICEVGDVHHPGHRFAKVRHAIRSSAALEVAGKSYPGLVDIRLMRSSGHPYTATDLAVADRYAGWLRAIAQAILELKAEGLPAPVVTGFDREDYGRRSPSSGAAAGPAPARAAEVGRDAPAIGAMLRAAAARGAADGGIVCASTGRAYTLPEIEAVGRRLASAVSARAGRTDGSGAGAGRVAVLCEDRLHQALLITAGLAAGLVVCPLDPLQSAVARSTLLRHLDPAVVVTDRPAAGPGERFVGIEALLGASPAGSTPAPWTEGSGGLLIYTSGTTGSPKGVLLDERQLGANVRFAIDHFGYDPAAWPAAEPGARWTSACVLPLHHTFATVSDLLPVLCAGGRVVIARLSPTDGGAGARALAEHEIRSFSAVPLLLDALVAMRVPLPASLRFVISGAAPLGDRTRERYLERFGHPVIPCYGLTESVCFATASPVTPPGQGTTPAGHVGKPAGIEVRVLGPDLAPVAAGETGEIALRGPSVITGGYVRGAGSEAGAERDEVFLEHGWFLTGDMGRLDGEGNLAICGRRKNMIIRGGEKVYLEDLDRCLEEHPLVAEACCVQVPGRFGYERAVAFLMATAPGAPACSADAERSIHAYVHERLGLDGGPDELAWVERIPRSATGKPLRAALQARLQPRQEASWACR